MVHLLTLIGIPQNFSAIQHNESGEHGYLPEQMRVLMEHYHFPHSVHLSLPQYVSADREGQREGGVVGKRRGEEGMMPVTGNHEISLESSRWPQLAHGTLALK